MQRRASTGTTSRQRKGLARARRWVCGLPNSASGSCCILYTGFHSRMREPPLLLLPPRAPSSRTRPFACHPCAVRALYALEAAWILAFDPASSRCRLDIRAPENRGLFVALFRHAQARV